MTFILGEPKERSVAQTLASEQAGFHDRSKRLRNLLRVEEQRLKKKTTHTLWCIVWNCHVLRDLRTAMPALQLSLCKLLLSQRLQVVLDAFKKKKNSTGAGFKTGFSTRTSFSVHVVAAAAVDKLWGIVGSVSSNKSLFLEH